IKRRRRGCARAEFGIGWCSSTTRFLGALPSRVARRTTHVAESCDVRRATCNNLYSRNAAKRNLVYASTHMALTHASPFRGRKPFSMPGAHGAEKERWAPDDDRGSEHACRDGGR